MKDCPPGSSINPATKKCRKDCKSTHERNLKGRCVKVVVDAALKKELAAIKKVERQQKALLRKQLAAEKKAEKQEKALLKKHLAKVNRDEKRKQKEIESGKKKEVARLARLARLEKRNNRIPHVIPFEPIVQVERHVQFEPAIVNPILVEDDVPFQGCEIAGYEVKAFSKILGIKYENRYNTCKFLSDALRLPKDTVLTKFLTVGSSGLIISAETPSGESYIAKIMKIHDGEEPIETRLGDVIPGNPIWSSTRTAEMEKEIKDHSVILDIHREKNLFGDVKGVSIPSIKSHHTVTLPNGVFGVIIIDRVHGKSTLKELLNSSIVPTSRKQDLFLKHATVIARFQSKGVSHGDPHAENIIVIDDTYDDIAIIDFGRASIFTTRMLDYDFLGTICHPDKRHDIKNDTEEMAIRVYDAFQVMLPFIFKSRGTEDFRNAMGGDKVVDRIRNIFTSSRCILAQRSESGKLSLFDQPGLDSPTVNDLTIAGRGVAFGNQGPARIVLTGYMNGDHSLVHDSVKDLKGAIFYAYDLTPLRSFIRDTDTEVSNHLGHGIPELGILAPTIPGQTIHIDWSKYV